VSRINASPLSSQLPPETARTSQVRAANAFAALASAKGDGTGSVQKTDAWYAISVSLKSVPL
jgi:hypothetical protein